MNEMEFGRRVAQHLNRGTREVDQHISERLKVARGRAMERYRVTEEQWVTAGAARAFGGRWSERIAHHSRTWLGVAALAVVVAMAGVSYWQQSQDRPDQGLLDAKMLSGELPLHAYTQPDFKAWLQESR